MRKFSILSICLVFFLSVSAFGAEIPEQLVPGGHTIGIKMNTDGLLIIGIAPVTTVQGDVEPAKLAGMAEGDVIIRINQKETKNAQVLSELTEKMDGTPLIVHYTRGSKMRQTTLTPVLCSQDGKYKLGIWVRDSMSGIGTLTFYDPDSGLFGSLGHGISDPGSGELIPMDSGYVVYSEVESVLPGQPGSPGELRGIFRTDHEYGKLLGNAESGLYGILGQTDVLGPQPSLPVPVGAAEEVTPGPAVIYSNVDGDTVEEYEIEIQKIYGKEHDARNFMIRITDPRLLEKTGGIVQGMSGSPILQNGKLIGAVTHVLVNDPKRGYGIFIETMIREGGKMLEEMQNAA